MNSLILIYELKLNTINSAQLTHWISNVLLITFLLWLRIELDIGLDIVNVHYVEPRSIYEYVALFNYYILVLRAPVVKSYA